MVLKKKKFTNLLYLKHRGDNMIKLKEILFLNSLRGVGKATIYKTYWNMLNDSDDFYDLVSDVEMTNKFSTEEIKKDLNINDEQLGLFGSLVYLGNMFGSLVSLTLINKLNRKYLLAVSLTLSGGFLMTFTIWSSLYFLFSNRIVVGMFQAFVSIYLPIWCDQFGIKRQRTIMIALIQVAPPLGVVLGYSITILCQKVIN